MKAGVRGAFVAGPAGPLATVTWDPPLRARGAVLYVPPFADEMNKSRHLVAQQARALALRGWSVTALDLFGTGDSAGDHADATWEAWRADVVAAWRALHGELSLPCVLWGLRLSALLVADVVATGAVVPAGVLLWQPVTSGRTFFTQWLRVASAAQLGTEGARDGNVSRAALAQAEAREIGGYGIHPALVAGAQGADADGLARPGLPLIVREVSIAQPAATLPTTDAAADRWRRRGAHVDVAAVRGASFWSSLELAQVPALIASTTEALERWVAARATVPA